MYECNLMEGSLHYAKTFELINFQKFPEWNRIFRNFQKDDNLILYTQILENLSPWIFVAYYFARRIFECFA